MDKSAEKIVTGSPLSAIVVENRENVSKEKVDIIQKSEDIASENDTVDEHSSNSNDSKSDNNDEDHDVKHEKDAKNNASADPEYFMKERSALDDQTVTSTSATEDESKEKYEQDPLKHESIAHNHSGSSKKSSSDDDSIPLSDDIVTTSVSNDSDDNASELLVSTPRKRNDIAESEENHEVKKMKKDSEDQDCLVKEGYPRKFNTAKRKHKKSCLINSKSSSFWYPIPSKYLVITGAKKDTLITLRKCSKHSVRQKQVPYRLQTIDSSLNRTPAGTCFKKLFEMIFTHGQITGTKDLQAILRFGFCYIRKSDMIKKRIKERTNSSDKSLYFTASDILYAINGLLPYSMHEGTLPNRLQRTIEHIFYNQLSKDYRSQLDCLVKKRNLIIIQDLDTDCDEVVTYEIKYKDDSKVYIFSEENDYVTAEENLIQSPLCIDLVRGNNSNFDLRYELNRIKTTSNLQEKPYKVISELNQGHFKFKNECIKIKKKYCNKIESFKKVITKRYTSSERTINKTVSNPLWKCCTYVDKQVHEYHHFDVRQRIFNNKNVYLEAHFEFNAEDWYQPSNGKLCDSVVSNFYKFGPEVVSVWKDSNHRFRIAC
ncbi:uncharacterized protein TRIADDRAFT_56821 [Trichoplax adhaerens]|uniref:Uncharacterized protein n=1 Tax=Trichoplax adhaerens TaxID=10228 RepID=B3RWN7_TRIAD|nr:predicted protein [Trichoplax adhaerens]EDV24730.1 predicted protein [Trichoplax adhaerens]|eukprot:XP_002112620.1 predicted protein [Trichoplax adhaerens]